MLLKKNYNGLMNDLFAAGVTLFILVTGRGPFNTAAPHTGNYQYIALNYFDKFWKVHEKKDKFSEDFKNLINSMLAFDPTHRLSISEIFSHPWMNQDTLMGVEIEEAMQAKVEQLIEMKKKVMLKQMKQKVGRQGVKKVQKRSITGVSSEELLKKHKFLDETQNLTDRMMPKLKTFADLELIFKDFDGEIALVDGELQLIKIQGAEEGMEEHKVRVQIKIGSQDEEVDIMKFKILEGNVYQLREILAQFDENILSSSEEE